MKSKALKRIFAISIILNLAITFFTCYQYRAKDSIKRDIILGYTSNQINIREYLSNALRDRENREYLMESLVGAKGCLKENTTYLGNVDGLGTQTELSRIERAYNLHHRGDLIVTRAIMNVSKGRLTQEDIQEIEKYIKVLDSYIKELGIDYGKAQRQSSSSLIKTIKKAIDRVEL